jgi:cell division protein FtsZ
VTKGLGAGANPGVGRDAALEDREAIAELIDGADMVFLTAGMGGGTGTGAAPIFAEVAKELGILTVAVVTKPFAFEGKRQNVATEGLAELTKSVDSLIVIPNERLMSVLGDDVSMLDAFEAANDVLYGAVSGIAEVIKCPGLVNVDFADVRTVMSEMGMAMMGSHQAFGEDRAKRAAEGAVASPLLEGVDLHGARGVLVNITASLSLKMKEVHEVMATIRKFTAEDATIIVGTVIDEDLDEDFRVTIVATGIGGNSNEVKAMPRVVRRTGTDDAVAEVIREDDDKTPAVVRRRGRQVVIEALKKDGVEDLDIPAFLRRSAD